VSVNATYDGVVRLPWSLATISTRSFCHTPTHEYVVPRSIPAEAVHKCESSSKSLDASAHVCGVSRAQPHAHHACRLWALRVSTHRLLGLPWRPEAVKMLRVCCERALLIKLVECAHSRPSIDFTPRNDRQIILSDSAMLSKRVCKVARSADARMQIHMLHGLGCCRKAVSSVNLLESGLAGQCLLLH
jgi:hypothetical protein